MRGRIEDVAGVASTQRATLTVRLNVPTTSSSAKTRVPKYISPATTQISVDVQQGGSSISGFPCCGTNGGIQVSDLSGNQRQLVTNNMSGGAIAYDPYAAQWLWSENGSCQTPTRCGVIAYDDNGNTVTLAGGFAGYPGADAVAGIVLVP